VTVTYQNDSVLLLSSGSYFYGNDVILRTEVVTDQALMSWVDQATVLPAGWLTRFFLHTFIAVGVPATSPPVPVRLQIWRPMGVMQFQLVWEYRLLMANNINSLRGVYVQVTNIIIDQVKIAYRDGYFASFPPQSDGCLIQQQTTE
jgi:hypothetical protein